MELWIVPAKEMLTRAISLLLSVEIAAEPFGRDGKVIFRAGPCELWE